MKNSKKILAIVLLFVMSIVSSMVALPTLATETDETPFNYKGNVTVSGNSTDGYTLSTEEKKLNSASDIATFKTKIDFKTQDIQFKTTITNGRACIVLKNSDSMISNMPDKHDLVTQNGVFSFNLLCSGTEKYEIRGYNEASDSTEDNRKYDTIKYTEGKKITSADTHYFGFAKSGDNWFLTVDGENAINLSTQETKDTIGRLESLIENGAYVQFAAYTDPSAPTTMEFSDIKVRNHPMFDNKGDTLTEGGNAIDGYSLYDSTNRTNVNSACSAVFNSTIDIKTQELQLKTTVSSRQIVMFKSTDSKTTNLPNVSTHSSQNIVALHFMKTGTSDMYVFIHNGAKDIKIDGFMTNAYPQSEIYKIGFSKMAGNWWLTINGDKVINLTELDATTKPTGDTDTSDDCYVSTYLENLASSGKAYIQLTSYLDNTNFSNIKLLDKSGVNLPQNGSLNLTGDIDDGYNISNKKINNSLSTETAVWNTPVDINTQAIRFKMQRKSIYHKAVFGITSVPYGLTGVNDTNLTQYNAVMFELQNGGDGVYILRGFSSGEAVKYESIVNVRYNDSIAHTFGFLKDESQNWWITVDGNKYINLTENDPTAATRLDTLAASGKAYLQFGIIDEVTNCSQIKSMTYELGDCNIDGTIDIRDLVSLDAKNQNGDIRIDDCDKNGSIGNEDLAHLTVTLLGK